MRNQKGFTLIELIIVIVVLGILAVTAAPQFINFSSDARASTVKGLKGALQGASQTIYAKAAIDGDLEADGSVNSVETNYGFPKASANGIISAANLSAYEVNATPTGNEDWAYVIGSSGGVPVAFISPADFIGGLDTTPTDGATMSATGCYASYQQVNAENGQPEINVVTTDC
ncbi:MULTISPECIES: prepilin-type N-terminal cleavage/methylation domain-containing protein [Idiomarina]|jgi:MSHA pilin protein MshA|uniref:prepilin-type N-terminal cleavage/methylation domain-containing protein n=1 Tax=Idiomarina TaxID=135575 RepID=UPI000C5BD7D7|nr:MULTISPECIES: prepilin-type N-terminal cleavage/methylation domain-containing protein [Idiomarina]MAO68710.1 Type II secretory pathway, pseudopilin [Idiomarina sp.]MBF81139.1 Type II secretory pathway, pseudopilin [Idiomarina sp.]|tara:strand:- start:13372 stop:13890 length:519 start_codon:yes stop_codon:yes gene_type:complete